MSLFDGLFGRNKWEEEEKLYLEREENLKFEIAGLYEDLKIKDDAIFQMKEDIARLQDENAVLNKKIHEIKSKPTQDDLIYKNLQDAKNKADKLNKFIKRYNLTYTDENYYYRVDVERFFYSSKFKDLVAYLKENDINYIEELDLSGLTGIKNINEARLRLEKFKTRKFIEWDILTYMNRGDRVTKVFSKSRKLTNLFADEDIEYMEDVRDYDFSKLLIMNFTPKLIKEFEKIREEYYIERRVSPEISKHDGLLKLKKLEKNYYLERRIKK